MNLEKLYRHRFDENELPRKLAIWRILCNHFFSKYINYSDTVVDIGAGYCEFINNINCAKKIAVDINPSIKRYADPNIDIRNEDCTNLASISNDFADVVFMSNFLEHLKDKQGVLDVLAESKRILRRGGKLIILQPNIRLVGGAYWDFFDHHTPLTEKSLVEALQILEMKPLTVIDRFLPYTTKSTLPQSPLLVALYLKLPIVWRILGKQSLIIAEK
jgi:SAM-dependent methyltransferase